MTWGSRHTWELRYLLQQANVHDMYKLCCKKGSLYFLQQLFATCNNLFGGGQVRFVGGKMGNNTIQLSLQQCCKTTCMVFFACFIAVQSKTRERKRDCSQQEEECDDDDCDTDNGDDNVSLVYSETGIADYHLKFSTLPNQQGCTTLISLIFARLNCRDFCYVKNFAKLKSRGKRGPPKLKTRNVETYIKTFI